MKNSKIIVLTLSALTLLVTSILLASMNVTASDWVSQPIYLHGPSLDPIHMHGPSLVPVHMHSLLGIINLSEPMDTSWHELYPDYCQNWTFSSWEDNGNGYLDSSDQIDMTNNATDEMCWYHVDRVTMTMRLWSDVFQEEMYVEYKGPYDPYIQPWFTNWTETWPTYGGVTGFPYHIITWLDNGDGVLSFCDFVEFEDWLGVLWHVEEYATDIILNEKIMDPIGIEWHELYPSFCNNHTLTSWEEPPEDPYLGRLSPGDQIDMINETSGITKWYFVDGVTLTLYITINATGEPYYFEYKGPFKDMYRLKTDPVCTYWHMIWPEYLFDPLGFHIEDWIDNCNGVLDYCDLILLEGVWYHVEELSIDIILNEKIADPTCTYWHELYPECCVNDYHIEGWEDNGDGFFSPSDNVTMMLMPSSPTDRYHVEEVTLTLNLTVLDSTGGPFMSGDRIYIEFLGGYQGMYFVKTAPLYTDWEVVCPTEWFGYSLTIETWEDTCNGILSFSDNIELLSPDGALLCHVDEVAVDMQASILDTTPPNIVDVSQTPPENNVLPVDEVKVNATVTDDLSGIKQVVLNYTNGNGTWTTVDMTNLGGNIWNGTIPAFPYCTNVTYVIMAEDNANNTITTAEMGYEYQYHVVPEFSSITIVLLFMMTTLAVIVVHRRKYPI